jgi:post-segregation antitoxin (ccd killing protein)
MKTTITFPKDLSVKARSLGINISRVSANAVQKMVEKIERPENEGGSVTTPAPSNRPVKETT